MFIRRNIRVGENCIAGIVLMLALVPVGMSQMTTAQESGPASSDTLEEIVVYGNRNIVHLRQVVYAAEDEFFAVFN